MQLTLFIAIILASVTSARDFTLYDDVNYGGAAHRETRNSNAACWNLNGKGDRASSVRGDNGCTTSSGQCKTPEGCPRINLPIQKKRD